MENRKIDIKFETALERLEEIAGKMEGDNLSLEESLKLFEEGMELAMLCNKKLDEAEGRINIVLKSRDGKTLEEDFTLREE